MEVRRASDMKVCLGVTTSKTADVVRPKSTNIDQNRSVLSRVTSMNVCAAASLQNIQQLQAFWNKYLFFLFNTLGSSFEEKYILERVRWTPNFSYCLKESLQNEMQVTSQKLFSFFLENGNPQVKKKHWNLHLPLLGWGIINYWRTRTILELFVWVTLSKSNFLWKRKLFATLKMMSKFYPFFCFSQIGVMRLDTQGRNAQGELRHGRVVLEKRIALREVLSHSHPHVYKSKFDF